ncbi:MAG: hypothetical protein WC332_01430 [Clostridia bacterium]|jgi:hypothetical protein
MASTTLWGQRKALGRRYSIDPAVELEKKRLEEEYSLMMPRAQLAEQKRQADINRQMQEDASKKSGMSGLVGSAGNLASTYMISKALTPASTVPTMATEVTSATPALTPASSFTMGGANASELAFGGTEAGILATPTTTPLATTGASGLTTGALTETAGTIAGEGGSLMSSAAALPMSAYVAPIGGGVVGGMLGKSGTGKDIGKALMFGQGGDKENAAVAGSVAGSVLGGVAGGIAAGASLTSWSGPGAIVGAVVGGIVGGVSALVDSHICTATHKIVGMSKEEIEKMKSLKEYALEKHFGWINSYMNNAPELILEITAQENNLVDFYKGIRTILIEPISKEEDMEKCFHIYLAVTKLLFKAYMPEFNFIEEN